MQCSQKHIASPPLNRGFSCFMEGEMELFFVYAYSMSKANLFDDDKAVWPLLVATRVISYHEDALEASWEVTRLINEDDTDEDECFAVEVIPLCNHLHFQV